MLLQVIIWGDYVRNGKNRISIYKGNKEVFYEQIRGELVHYKELKELGEVQEAMTGQRPVVICTNHIQSYGDLRQSAERNESYLLFIPQMQDLNIETILSLAVQAASEKASVSLGGKGKTVGEMIMEMLKNFHLFHEMDSYELVLKVKESMMINSLAEMEDVLREYVPDKGELLLTPWDEEKQPKEEMFYLLKGKK